MLVFGFFLPAIKLSQSFLDDGCDSGTLEMEVFIFLPLGLFNFSVTFVFVFNKFVWGNVVDFHFSQNLNLQNLDKGMN